MGLVKGIGVVVLVVIGISMALRGTDYSTAYSIGLSSRVGAAGPWVVVVGAVVAVVLITATQL